MSLRKIERDMFSAVKNISLRKLTRRKMYDSKINGLSKYTQKRTYARAYILKLVKILWKTQNKKQRI